MHALGVLLMLPTILTGGEVVESLSLGAGSSETRRFDLETNRRIAEFTFTEWQGNDNARLQKVFKDFFRLAEFATDRYKQLWVSDDKFVLKYLRSGSSVYSATHKSRNVWEEFSGKYPTIERVGEYFRLHADNVHICVYGRDNASL